MRKIFILLLTLVLAASISGCSTDNNETKDPSTVEDTVENGTSELDEFEPSLGGIKRGDSKQDVINAFGTDYEETVLEDDNSLGEPFERMTYKNDITVIIGSDSNKVLEIETTSPDTSTNLGFKVGDKAEDVLTEYRSKYEEPKSRHEDRILEGWFLIKDQDLVIFNFDKSGILVNKTIEPDSQIERIKVSNFNYMD